jgi:hypothetical protein
MRFVTVQMSLSKGDDSSCWNLHSHQVRIFETQDAVKLVILTI